jgi:hypothetical protein
MSAPSSTPVGWTDARTRRALTFVGVFVAGAVLALFAMVMPWMSMHYGSVSEPCVVGDKSNPIRIANSDNKVVEVSAAGCISARQFVNIESFAGESLDRLKTPYSAPTPEATMTIPSTTFWLVVSAALGAVSLVLRNAIGIPFALLALKSSYGGFTDLRTSIGWGLQEYGHEMYGMHIHQGVTVGLLVALIGGGVFLIKTNAEQRKVHMAEYKAGERDNPPAMVTAQLAATYMLRGNLEKMSEAAAAAKEEAKSK